VGQRGANEEVLVENRAVLHLVFEVHQDGILDELCLKETFLVDRAVEEALVAEVPEEIHCVILGEEVFGEVPCEVRHLVTQQPHCLVLSVMIDYCAKLSVEQSEEGVVLLEDLVQNAGVFLSKRTILELRIGDCFTIIAVFISVVDTVKTFRVLDHNIEPDVRLHLAEHVRMRAGCNALNWRLHLGERLEKVDDSL